MAFHLSGQFIAKWRITAIRRGADGRLSCTPFAESTEEHQGMHAHTKETQATMTPAKALAFLLDGNRRFVNNLRVNRNLLQQVNETAAGQFPFAVILSCIDSRTSAELIFDQGLGDVFCVRIAGRVVDDDVLGSMEFACALAGSKLILVLGHTRCGAVKGACDGLDMGHLTGLLAKITPSVERVRRGTDESAPERFEDQVTHDNTRRQMGAIVDRSDILRDLYERGRIGLAAGMYFVETGEVQMLDVLIRDEAGDLPETGVHAWSADAARSQE
jgi:carbonic anhydrase